MRKILPFALVKILSTVAVGESCSVFLEDDPEFDLEVEPVVWSK